MQEPTRYVFEQGQLVVDERYFPVVIGTWLGRVTDESIDAYYAWYDGMLHRAAEHRTKLASITDALDARAPGSDVRSRFALETNHRAVAIRECVDSVLVVARGPRLLGTVASILYRTRHGMRMSSFGTMPAALERALIRFDAAGIERPEGLDPLGYERPPALAS